MANQVNRVEARVWRDSDGEVFFQLLAPGQVFYPVGIQQTMWQLHESAVVHSGEPSRHQRDAVDEELDFVDLDAVADVVGVFDEEEDAGCQEISHGARKSEAEAGECGEYGRRVGVEVVDEERSCELGQRRPLQLQKYVFRIVLTIYESHGNQYYDG